ncbi:DUF421 domain-containing protein [Ructibacterium gallinarum]|uniref:DUF421 domain-containing protein n=1 Tax=Ructibacterium gallinarum TaxID=2779355 RepID=A0A9D5R8A9_9FIRM|nr:DUF421 domain-containing protein [Ructibacterium gallinarum]MBE5040226.1 DUF421 domain-containing protein [Ructibacterium gallinarum]
MGIVVLRTIVMYIFVVLTLRLMGKRQIGELEASELVVTIIISEIAAMPITNTGVPLSTSVIAILILMILEVVLSDLAYRSMGVRTLLYGRPSMFFQKGKLHQQEMKRQRFNVADLMEELRNNGAVSLSQVDYVMMETNGKVSVILNAESSPVTPPDLQQKPEPVRMSYVIVDNGTLVRTNLKRLGLNEEWLYKQLNKERLKHWREVFYLSFEQDSGKVVLIPKEKGGKKR